MYFNKFFRVPIRDQTHNALTRPFDQSLETLRGPLRKVQCPTTEQWSDDLQFNSIFQIIVAVRVMVKK